MKNHCALGDCQPQSHTASFAITRFVHAIKRTKDLFQSGVGHTWPMIANFNLDNWRVWFVIGLGACRRGLSHRDLSLQSQRPCSAGHFRRRVAENMLGALTSNASRNTFIFGGPADGDGIVRNQVVYRIDFDDPARASTARHQRLSRQCPDPRRRRRARAIRAGR